MSEQNSTSDGDADPHHSMSMLLLLVLVFFTMGLVGFLICHVLKKKGYRCRTFRDELDLEHKEVLTELQANEEEELNEDTVEKIVRCIIQNEANVEALKEMLGDGEGDVPVPMLSLCPHRNSQDGGLPHHHTVHLGSTQAPCIHCSKRKRPPLHRQGRSKDGKGKMHPRETTVFSVGRFHVTHIEKKPIFPEQQDVSLPDGSKEAGDKDPAAHSNEQVHQEDLQNGTIQIEGCPNGTGQGEDSPNAPVKANALTNGPVGKRFGKTGSLQDFDLQDLAPRNGHDQNKGEGLQGPGMQSAGAPADLQEEVKWAEPRNALQEEAVPGAANETAEVKRSQGVQEGIRAAMVGNKDANRKESRVEDIGQQEQNFAAQDPGVTV
ncbi:RELT-like protein 2 [Gopherus evgoodei]|uniref:RELT-like protein 2 n=1 Tax=Gopherus evgoodei TaxID=1825980 RepID=UPI0011CFB864|nr:RELT-like protein 2 [Gopherus evgoodei]XP_030427644.1 RELT-like protein 2 [Gopherus evgoodei]XP_030427645.1 RELT-like protein 2 [Gopherus evgoodei]